MLRALLLLPLLLAVDASALDEKGPGRGLVEDLKKGGYVLYARHFETDQDQADTDPMHLDNTAAQRQLTDAGRKQAAEVGEALRKLAIPFERVLCSRFQRTHESAKLMAVGDPKPIDAVSAPASARSEEEKRERSEALRRLLATPPAPGMNTLVVSHNSNLRDAAGIEFADVREGEIVVFQPSPEGGFREVARVYPPSIWSQWSRDAP